MTITGTSITYVSHAMIGLIDTSMKNIVKTLRITGFVYINVKLNGNVPHN